MKRILFFLISIMCFAQYALAQPATYSVPISIGRNNCGGGGTTKDSVYFFNYVSGSLTRASYPNAYKPRLKIGPISTVDRWSIFAASISYNPKDQKLYYLWTDYSNTIRPTGTWTYIWRWKPDTTFTVGATLTTNYIDTLRSFPYDIGGVAFDNNGTGWTLEFPSVMPATRAFFRPIDFAAGIYNPADTLDFVPSTGLGSKLYNVGSGDITMMPSGQIYYNFDNKLYTPDYGSYGGATHHIKSTFIDTTRRPTGSSALVGLAFGDGDLISSYATGCLYRRLDPVTGDTNFVSYTYSAGKGVYSVDMTQLTSGVGASKKLISVTPTGTPNQYDVIYDVFVRNYGTTPITNVQVTDNLSLINGLANVSNVTATLTSNPAGVSLNPLYNGTIITTLLAPAQTLPNYPSSNNNFTIRISCRLSNIQQGVVYYNQAVTTANGFNNTALRDSSTNGNNPDLNQNDKPDDAGESQPTPFVVILTPITPPCATLAQTLYSQDFGSGTGMNNNIPSSVAVPSASTTFIGTAATPMPVNRFTVTNNAINGDGSNWVNLTDHTGGANGRMLLINADAAARIAYADTMPVVCPGQQYSVSFWAAFVGNSAYKSVCDGLGGFKYSQLLVRVRDLTTGLVITQYTTDTIKLTSWQQHGMKWVMPAGYSQVILELVNAAPGGCGNDFALDDIQFGICDPVPTVSLSGPGACLNSSVTFTSALSDASIIPGAKDYQWQWSPAPGSGPWTNIAGATSSTYTINPVNPADTGRFYRVIVAAQGNIGNATCQYISTGLKLNGFAPSTAPASISAPAATVCNNGMVTVLTATGGTLGTGANYQWGTGSVVGTNPIPGATFSTLTVSPTSTTTYWVRIENTSSPCTATTGGVTTTITVNQPSTAPSSVTGLDICNGSSTTLTAVGGTLGTGANYQWGTGAVVGTSPIVGATSSTLTVSPTSTTTYWVRIENNAGPCSATTSGLTKVITVRQPSTAPSSVTGLDICNGSSTTLTAVGGTLGTGANYQWGTGAVVGTSPIVGATFSTLTVSPTSTTTYWVRIENTTAPCSATTSGLTKVITVNQPSTAPSSVSGSDICNGSSVTLTAVGGTLGTGANYQWGTGAVVGTSPIVGATSSTLTVSPTSTTTYWVRIENTTAPCSATTSGLTKVITVNQPSTAPSSVTGLDICNGSSTTLTAIGGTLGTGANYQWGTGAVVGTSPIVGATGSTLTVSPTSTTTYWVRIENTTAPCGATTSGLTKVITVRQPSTAPSSVSGSDICNGSSVTLTAVGGTLGTGANYQWGTGAVVGTSPIVGATSSTLTVSPTSTTTYWVRIENTTAPCSATTSGLTKVITVNQPSTAPSSVTGLDICNGSSTTLTAIGGTLGTGANYQWGTGAVVGTNPIVGATGSTLTVSPTSTTTYWVRIENTTGPCATNTSGLTKVITVSQPSVAASSANKNKNNVCPGISVQLSAAGGTLGTGASWKWYTGSPGGTLVGTGATLTVTPAVTTTYYVRAEGSCNTTAAAAVTVTINCDIDKDDDGIPDFVESNMAAAFADANSNGVINAYDPTYAGFVDYNNDFVNDNFQADGDSDNDGIPNYMDTDFPGRVDTNGDGIDDRFDQDKDGVINMLDLDSDNDGIPDVVEAYGVDTNGDGKIDNLTDTDGDGLSDNVDTRINAADGAYNTGTGLGVINLDGDAWPNFLDLDSDNDGIPDVREVFGADANNNGIIDGFVDVNGDGLHDSYINAGALLLTGADGNNDGRADSWPNKNLDRDLRPNAYDLDSDGDGIVDAIEAGGGITDANLDGLADGSLVNGWSSSVSALSSLTLRNTDSNGNPDYLDIDSDNDGIPDNIEGMSTAGYQLPTTTDTDGDGLASPYDNLVGFGGSGIFVYDNDGDGTPDYRDLDTDGDGSPDLCEGNDWNLNGMCDEILVLTNIDTDGDGLDNLFDSLNSVTNLKGTSYMMGNGGSLIGDAAPGTRATVQKKTVAQGDRDWRWTATVLPVQFLSFTGVMQNTIVDLNWSIITSKAIDRFEIERSTDNASFSKVGTVTDAVQLNIQQGFGFADDISGINSDIFYYRLKAIGKSGEFKYSNILVVRRSQVKTPVSIMPNPANDYVTVRFYVEKEQEVTIRLVDNVGKTVLQQKQKAAKGSNAVQLTNLAKYSTGLYSVQVLVNGELVTQKLLVSH